MHEIQNGKIIKHRKNLNKIKETNGRFYQLHSDQQTSSGNVKI